MKRCGLILLLLSGYVMVCHLQSDQLVRQLHLVDLQKSWNDAQQYCRDEYIDLAIVNSSALIQEAQKRAGSTEAWIGLSKDWTWSQTGPVQSSWFNMWSPGQPGTDECVIITGSGSWFTRPCSATYYFVCYDAATNKHILVKNSMTWSDIQVENSMTPSDIQVENSMTPSDIQVENSMTPSDIQVENSMTPSDIQVENSMTPSDILVENSMTPSDILVENSMTPSDILVENSMTPSDIQVENSMTPSDIQVENSMTPSDILVENSMTPSDILVENSMTPSDIQVENSMTPSDIQVENSMTPSDILVENSMTPSDIQVENSMTPSDILVENSMTPSDILVENSMTWSDAQSYCRQTYTDLSTITNTQDNSQVASMLSDTAGAWIGLYRKYWTWSNSSRASNLPWGPGQPDDSVNCATIVRSTGSFNSHNCDDQRPFLCSRDVKPSALRSVKVQLRAGSADLNDPTVQESILQQVREKLVEQGVTEEVKLRWRTQPDGKVFHREEETAAYSEKEDCGGLV
ncbi:uncharacterized protein LOC112435532 isoform X2 [Maylandia zebra]